MLATQNHECHQLSVKGPQPVLAALHPDFSMTHSRHRLRESAGEQLDLLKSNDNLLIPTLEALDIAGAPPCAHLCKLRGPLRD